MKSSQRKIIILLKYEPYMYYMVPGSLRIFKFLILVEDTVWDLVILTIIKIVSFRISERIWMFKWSGLNF